MKRLIILIFTFACVSLLFTGTAFAGTAPDAASYFTHPGYNKTYTGEDGTSHTMTVKWVGETWNKLGTVIYSINYEDVYQKDGNTYIDVMSATEIYENARPSYPDNERHSVYQVKWYANGSQEVVSDYRPTEPEQTSSPTPTEQPETPASSETATPSSAQPSVTSEIPITTPSAASGDTATTESTPASPNSSVSDSTISAEETPTITSTPTPSQTETNMAGESISPSPSVSSSEIVPELAPQDVEAAPFRWAWVAIILLGIGAVAGLAFFRESKRRKENQSDEDHTA